MEIPTCCQTVIAMFLSYLPKGGTPRQITSGDFNFSGNLSWSPDSKYLLVSANMQEGWEYRPNDSEIHEVEIATGKIKNTNLPNRSG